MKDENIINKIFAEYEEKRTKASAERKKRIDFVNKNYPQIAEINKKIFKLGLENTTNIFNNPEKKDEYNKNFKEKLESLNKEKNKIISENNIDPDYDSYKYECEICHDTGYDDEGKKCICFKQKMIDAAYSMSNMADMVKEQNFDKFSLDYYSDEKGTEGISPRENMVKILNKCKSFCENFDNKNKSLLFYGSVGLGKTFLSSSIAKEIMDSGKTVVYVRATRLFTMYEDYRFGRKSDRGVIDNIYNSDLLIIDDLGTEMNSTNNVAFLFDVVNERVSSGKKIIINTNLGLSDLTKMYTTRFTSRLYEFFNMYKFFGEDIRLQKLKKGE